MKKVLFLVLTLFLFSFSVKADCYEKEYLDWSYNLEPVFTVFNYNDHMDLDVGKYRYAYFLSLSKTRDDVTFNVTDRYNNTMPATDFEEIGIYGVGLYNGIDEETYKIEVYGNAKGKCNGQLITTLNYTVPAYNEYYKTQYCDKYKEHELCQVFTNKTQSMTLDEFKATMGEYDKEQNGGFFRKVLKFLGKIWIYLLCVIIPIVGVSIYYNLKIRKYKKMRNRNEVRRYHKTHLFIFMALLLLSVVRVNASLTCGDATITEGKITSAGWDVNLNVCEWYKTDRNIILGQGGTATGTSTTPEVVGSLGGYSGTDGAKQRGHDTTYQSIYSQDGKSTSTIEVPMCITHWEGGPGQFDAIITCKYDWTKDVYGPCNSNETGCVNGSKFIRQDTGSDSCPVTKKDVPENFTASTSDCNCVKSEDYTSFSYTEANAEIYVVCPIYACKPTKTEIKGWCNATFKVGDDEAYCVNPSDKFPNGIPNNYQTQKFDPTTCASSNSTPDCGFANILIEAAYYNQNHTSGKISYETINMAMRLWSAETELGGFYRIGLAYMMGYDCSEYIAYSIADNPNVYQATLKEITKLYFTLLSEEGIDHSVEGLLNSNTLKSINCATADLGVVCRGKTDTYVQAFALYFNTFFGNAEMQSHLAAIYGGRTTEPISATVTSEIIDEYSVIKVDYREEITAGEKIACADIKAKQKRGETLTEREQKVFDHCNNKITHVIGVVDGQLVDLASGKVVTDLNGDGKINDADFLLLPEATEFEFDYCIKNSCFSKVVYFATCDTVKTEEIKYETVYTTIRYTESAARYSIKKYIACGSGDYQIMFSYDKYEGPGRTWDETTEEEKEPIKTVKVDFYCYDGEMCDDGLSIEESCASKSGGHGTVEVKDPSLSCIVNMRSSISRKSYDYSDFFGVNSKFCKIYCSDTATFYLADKVDIYSGLSFKMDIEYDVFGNNKSNRSLSSIVKMKRDCVSKIFYDNNKFEEDYQWNTIYDGLETNPKSWKELHDNLKKYGLSSAHINEIEYDLYNCNLYSDIPVYRPKNNKIGNVYSRIKELYSAENSYGFNGSKYGYNFDSKLSDTQNNIIYSDVKYGGGANYIGSQNRVGDNYGDITLSHELNNHNGSEFNGGNVSRVTYCTGKKCFEYDRNNKYVLPNDLGDATDRHISTAQGRSIPTNDYAYFSIVNEVDFYNSSRFQVESYTGDINDVTNKAKDSDYTDLDPYLYPVGKDANVLCTGGKCSIDYKISVVETYYRNASSGTSAFKDKIKEFIHSCPIDYESIPTSGNTEVIYRNVSLANMFPTRNPDGSRVMGDNWKSAEDYVNEIEQFIKAHGEHEYYVTHLEYSYTLTQDAIKKIKEYNATAAGSKSYNDNSIEKGTCVDVNRQRFKCRTDFITAINNDTNSFGIINNRASSERGVSEYTQDKKKETNKN